MKQLLALTKLLSHEMENSLKHDNSFDLQHLTVSNYMFIIDKEHRLLFLDHLGAKFFQVDAHALEGELWYKMGVPEEIQNEIDPLIEQVFANGKHIRIVSQPFPTKYGIKHFQYQLSPFYTSQKKISAVFSFVHEVTDFINPKTTLQLVSNKLTSSENLYRDLFNQTDEIFSLYSVKFNKLGMPIDMVYVDVTSAFEREFCVKLSEIVGKSLVDVFPTIQQEEINWISLMSEVAQTGKTITLEHDIFNQGHWYKTSIYSPKPNFIAIFTTTLTKIKKFESAIRVSEERWRTALASTKQGVWQSNLKTNQFFYSPWYKNILGYEPGEKGSSNVFWHSQVHPDDQNKVLEAFNQLANGQTDFYETEYRMKDHKNEYLWILSRGKVVRNDKGEGIECIGIHTDITRIKNMEQSLIANELLYRTLYENIGDCIFLIETDNLGNPVKYVEVNDAACCLLGYEKSELLRLSPMDIRPNETSNEIINCFREIKKKGYGIFDNIYKAKDGTLIPVELRAKSFTLGNTNYVMGISRNLSERKSFEDLLKKEKKRKKRQKLLNEIVTNDKWNPNHWENLKYFLDRLHDGSFICYLLKINEQCNNGNQLNEQVDEIYSIQDKIIEKLESNEDVIVWLTPEGIGIINYYNEVSNIKEKQAITTKQILKHVNDITSKFTVYLGISELTTIINDLRTAFQQSLVAIQLGQKLFQNKKVFHYRELGVLQLVPFINDEYQVSTYIDRTIGKIITHDQVKNSDYLSTLEAILGNNNLKDVAKVLFIHYKTVQLRKNKIEKILEISLDNVETRLSLSIAIKLLRIFKNND